MTWTMDAVEPRIDKTFVVTGANAGIGFATAAALCLKGGQVILACRSLDKAENAVERIKSTQPNAMVRAARLDLANLGSIRGFAEALGRQQQTLDVLINNAGVMTPPFGHTSDGFETQFGTNFLGHFLLTILLLPLLNRAPAARVVTVSSIAHWSGRIDFTNLNAERGYSKWGAYAQSKLANIMFSYELQRRLAKAGVPTISVGAHPGGTVSELARHSPVLSIVERLIAQPTVDGALPSLRAALDPDARGGEYFGPSGLGTVRGPPVKQRSSRRSNDVGVATRLWDVAAEMVGEHYP